MAPRTGPWLVAAVGQAVAIGLLLLHLAAEPGLAKPSAGASLPETSRVTPGTAGTGGPTDQTPSPAAAAVRPSASDGPTRNAPATPLGTLLHGTLRVRNGAKLDTAWLSVFLGEEPKPLLQVTVSQQVQYAIPGLAAGDYRLTARSANMRNFEQAFVVPAAATDVVVDVWFEPSWLLKVLLQAPDGRPLHEAIAGDKDLQGLGMFGPVHVIAWGSELPVQLPSTDGRETTFSIATWQASRMLRGGAIPLPAKYAGLLELREDRAAVVAAVLCDTVLAQVPVQPGQDEVTLVVDPAQLRARLASVRLQVVDATTNQPVPNAKVGLNDSQSWRQPTAADAEGRYEQGKLRPGTYQLTIDPGDGRIAPMVAVQLAPGMLTDLGAIPVAAPFELRVKVTGLPAEQRGGATLTALESQGPPSLSPRSTRLAVEKDELKANVWPGRYLLRIAAGSNGALVEFDTRRLGGEALTVALQPEPTLQIDPSQLDEPVRLVLRNATGAVVHDRWITWKTVFPVQLPAGEYKASLQRVRGDRREEPVTVAVAGGKYVLR